MGPTLPTPRPPHQSQPELSGPGRGGRRGRLLQVTWTRADRTSGRAKSFGGGEVEGRRPPGERGDPAWKHQNKGCVRAGAVWKDGEELDHWRRGCGVLTLWVIKPGGGLSRAGARGDGSGGVPEHLESHFPRSSPTPNTPVPRGAGGAQLVYSWQLTRRLWSGEGPLPARRGRRKGRWWSSGGGAGLPAARGVRPATEFGRV